MSIPHSHNHAPIGNTEPCQFSNDYMYSTSSGNNSNHSPSMCLSANRLCKSFSSWYMSLVSISAMYSTSNGSFTLNVLIRSLGSLEHPILYAFVGGLQKIYISCNGIVNLFFGGSFPFTVGVFGFKSSPFIFQFFSQFCWWVAQLT
jgi:hypothetical protein